jgi:DNA-binding CsgD family transcriptional regulator
MSTHVSARYGSGASQEPAPGSAQQMARTLSLTSATGLVADSGSTVPGASALTAAELRLLPMLSTHLSFPEIAAQMFLALSTIKSQAMSIYRKLGASSRSQAVARSRELGLLEGRSPSLSSHQEDGTRPARPPAFQAGHNPGPTSTPRDAPFAGPVVASDMAVSGSSGDG